MIDAEIPLADIVSSLWRAGRKALSMKLQRSPNRWSCLPTSFAMVLGIPLDQLIRVIGHDGSEIWWPSLPDPFCRRAFHIQELINASWMLGYTVTPFEPYPQLVSPQGGDPHVVSFGETPEVRMDRIMQSNRGVITGLTPRGQHHAVAWNCVDCYDPNGTIYGVQGIRLECFLAIKSK